MIDLIAAAVAFGVSGYLAGAIMTKHTLISGNPWHGFQFRQENGDIVPATPEVLHDALVEKTSAHVRCADALGTTQRKLSAIRDLLDTPQTIRKADLRDVLDGEQG